MSVQENFTEKNWIGRNYRIIRQFFNVEPTEITKETGISKQNLSTWENENGNPGHKQIKKLSDFFGLPNIVFYMEDLTTELLEKMKNNTREQNEPAISEKEEVPWEVKAFRKIVEGGAEYILVSRAAFEGSHRFTSVEQVNAQTEQIRMLTRAFIDFVKESKGLGSIPDLSKIEEAQKNAGV